MVVTVTPDPSPHGLDALPALQGSSTLSSLLYDVLEEAILDGGLEPGQRLHADDIAEYYGMSRIPVRETLRALDAAGWVELRPRHGAYVRGRSAEELTDLFEMRLLLETESAVRAAQLATPEHIADLERILEAQRLAFRDEDHIAAAEHNHEFHGVMADAAGNLVLTDFVRSLSKRVRFYFAGVAHDRGHQSMAEHARLIRAVKARDVDAAATITRAHIEATRAAVEKLIRDDL